MDKSFEQRSLLGSKPIKRVTPVRKDQSTLSTGKNFKQKNKNITIKTKDNSSDNF